MAGDGGRRPGRAPQILEELVDGLNVTTLDAISVALEAKQDAIPTGTYVQVHDIRRYGGLVDGTTDEASFIQAAMTAPAATVAGGVVLIPAHNAKVILVGVNLGPSS